MSLLAKDVMSSPVVSCPSGTRLIDAARLMVDNNVGSILVVNAAGDAIGIVTESDFTGHQGAFAFSSLTVARLFGRYVEMDGLESIYKESKNKSVNDIMSARLISVTEQTPIETVVNLLVERDIKRVPVLAGKKAVGIVARHDLLRVMLRSAPLKK